MIIILGKLGATQSLISRIFHDFDHEYTNGLSHGYTPSHVKRIASCNPQQRILQLLEFLLASTSFQMNKKSESSPLLAMLPLRVWVNKSQESIDEEEPRADGPMMDHLTTFLIETASRQSSCFEKIRKKSSNRISQTN